MSREFPAGRFQKHSVPRLGISNARTVRCGSASVKGAMGSPEWHALMLDTLIQTSSGCTVLDMSELVKGNDRAGRLAG